MAAAKEKTIFQPLARIAAMLLLLAAIVAPAHAHSAPENRAWEKSASTAQSLLSQPLQLLEPHQVNTLLRLYDAPGDTVAPKSAVGSGGTANSAQYAKLKEFYRQAEKYGADGSRLLENGRYRFYGEFRPASTPGEMAGARLVREWDPASGATRTWMETLDQAGTVRSVAPKPPIYEQNHFIFDAAGNYVGRR